VEIPWFSSFEIGKMRSSHPLVDKWIGSGQPPVIPSFQPDDRGIIPFP
jgi:hypothetical protein